MTFTRLSTSAGSLLALSLVLTGCGSSGSDSKTPTTNPPVSTKACSDAVNGIRTCTLNATSSISPVYLDLATGDTSTQAGNWDLAFLRYNVTSNGGSTGSGNRGLNLAVKQADLYEADGTTPKADKFNAANAANTLTLLDNLTVPAASSAWTKDKLGSALQPAYTGSYPGKMDFGWYYYYPTANAASADGLPAIAHSLGANSSKGWLLKSGTGDSYARFRATAVSNTDGTALSTVGMTFQFDIQHKGASAFTDTATWTPSKTEGDACYDFDQKQEVACTGTQWDLKASIAARNATLSSNGGVSGSGAGKAVGPLDWSALSTYVSGTHDGHDTLPDAVYVTDSNNSLFSTSPWLEYNINNDHRMLPNYRVYLLNTNTTDAAAKVYAVQVIGYYGGSTGATSGYITLRYKEVAR